MTPRTVTGHPPKDLAHRQAHVLSTSDVFLALSLGWRDFLARPSHLVFLVIVYPVIGFVLVYAAFSYAVMPLVFPLMAGFALIAPLSAVGVFELSRRIERGESPRLGEALSVTSRPGFGGVLTVAAVLLALFVAWIVIAQQIVFLTIGAEAPSGFATFLGDVVSTGRGQTMFLLGNAAGFCFALAALVISVFSLPMLVDGETSGTSAMLASLRASLAYPVPVALWGLVVAGLLALAMLPAFAGLVVVLPWLGHATWHFYRRAFAR